MVEKREMLLCFSQAWDKVQRAACNVQRVVCSVQRAACSVQRAACSVQHATSEREIQRSEGLSPRQRLRLHYFFQLVTTYDPIVLFLVSVSSNVLGKRKKKKKGTLLKASGSFRHRS